MHKDGGTGLGIGAAVLFPGDWCPRPPGREGGRKGEAFDIISPRIGMIGCGKWLGVDPVVRLPLWSTPDSKLSMGG